jgi:hypothetical protein
MKLNPHKAVQAAREVFQDHLAYCPVCDQDTGYQCPRGAQLWTRVAVAIRRAGGPARVRRSA